MSVRFMDEKDARLAGYSSNSAPYFADESERKLLATEIRNQQNSGRDFVVVRVRKVDRREYHKSAKSGLEIWLADRSTPRRYKSHKDPAAKWGHAKAHYTQ